jgi:hypothetical protein
MSELNQLEDTHRNQVQQHQNAKLNLEIREQQQQFIHAKCHVFDADIASAAQISAVGSPCQLSKSEKRSARKLPDEETLLQEFAKQYSIQKQQLKDQYHDLVICYTSRSKFPL